MNKLKIIILFCLFSVLPAQAQSLSDSQKLGMALDYFQGRKYHEALLIFQKLGQNYQLNPRFVAYTGVCYYYEWDYQRAAECFDKAIPQLKSFAPSELSFYYFAAAESHFNLKQYDKALPLYEKMLTLCKDDEKADAYYKLGFIHTNRNEWLSALDNFHLALTYYRRFRPDEQARIAQIRNMIVGCCDKIDQLSKK